VADKLFVKGCQMKETTEDIKKKISSNLNMDFIKELMDWNYEFSLHNAPSWEKLPDIDLYMDQVVTFLDRQMKIHRRNEEDKLITPSMINNYTKDHVIPRAKSKKYSKEHIALIMIVCSLKKVLSMPDLSGMLKDLELEKDENVKNFYEMFCEYQSKAIANTSKMISDSISNSDILKTENESCDSDKNSNLKNLALELAVDAQARCIAAEQILTIIEKKETD
jgi:hypothetical protein